MFLNITHRRIPKRYDGGRVFIHEIYLAVRWSDLMRQISIFIIFLLTTLTGLSDESVFDTVTPIGTNGLTSAEWIYPLEGRQTPQCHASTIESTPTGLVAAWFGGTHEKNPDVGIWVSRKVDGKWTRPVEVVNGVESKEVRYPCWNPVLFQLTDGPLVLFYKVGPTPHSWWGMKMTSKDGGRTWSKPMKLGEDKAIGDLIGPVKNPPIELEDGSLLCPSSTEHNNWRVHFERSPDGGKTWEVIGPIHDGEKYNAIQPSILRYEDGSMQVLCRTQESVLVQSWSRDGGKTWTEPEATSLPNPNAGTDATTLQDGRQILIYNHTTRRAPFPGNRNMLNVAISRDGKNWKTVLTLERDKSEYSYPTVIQDDTGTIHVVYTWRRQTVKHVEIDPKQMK